MSVHVVLWSAMRSGSTEFAKDLARVHNWKYADEPFNPKLSVRKRWRGDEESLLEKLSGGKRLVFKLFPGHSPPHVPICKVVLERKPEQRWCSLVHARRTGEWTGRVRRNCSMKPPPAFKTSHRIWFSAATPDIRLTFEDIVFRRNESLARVGRECDSKKIP